MWLVQQEYLNFSVHVDFWVELVYVVRDLDNKQRTLRNSGLYSKEIELYSAL